MALTPNEITCDKNVDVNSIKFMSLQDSKKVLAGLSKGLANEARLQIVRILANASRDERCNCGDIVNALPLAQSSVSQHLKILKETGWIQGTIDGKRVCYCLVGNICEYYSALLKRVIETER